MPVIKEKKVKEIKVPEVRKPKELKSQRSANSILVFVIVILLLVILVGAGFIFYPKIFKQTENENKDIINVETWQAVFLSNGQVYFGHALNKDSQYVTLSDVYYLQLKENETPADQLETGDTNTNKQNISLMKLGNELHGPEDEMTINRDHILFIEDLKSSSPVVKAINDLYNTE